MNVLAKDLTKQDRYDDLTSFGVGQPTAVKFLGEDSGLIRTPDVVDNVTQYTEIFGQGVTATTAQIASIYQTIGNHGVRQPLTLVSGCEQPDGKVTDTPDSSGVRVISESAADQTVQMLESVAQHGSLRSYVGGSGYRIALKSGTAEVARNGVYTADRVISVAGIVPADNPQFAIIVVFGLPQIERSSAAAAPAFAKLMEQTLKYYRVPPSSGKPLDLPSTW